MPELEPLPTPAQNAEERVLPADHECTVVEFIGIGGHWWRCACGRAYRKNERHPALDDRPLRIDGETDA